MLQSPSALPVLLLMLAVAGAQSQTALEDTLSTPDSVAVDSMKAEDSAGLESPIYYWTDEGGVSKINNKLYLSGNAKIVYQDLVLEAEKITIDREQQILFAEGVFDTVDARGDSLFRGTPVFTEKGREPMYGSTLFYDFKTKRGKITTGKTQMPPGYYRGSRVHKISEQTLLVKDGYFTSCEYIDDPHFYFKSDEMRVAVSDKIVARPVYFYIADVPLFAIPFGVFPNKKGRRSGIIIPAYGESGFGGRFLKNLGYYWAPNDYMDATFQTDFYDKLGFTYKADISYIVRYLLNGRVNGYFYPKDPNSGQPRQRWAVSFNHSHTIDPTLRIAASGKFQSDKSLEQDYSSNFARRTQQVITSNFTINKSFKGTKNSLSANISRTENLQNGNIDYTFPNLRFSRSQTSVYETFTGRSGRGGDNFFQKLNFSYNSQLLRRGSRRAQTTTPDDTVSAGFDRSETQGVQHRLALNAPQKILSYLNITPSINYTEVWVDEITTAAFNPETNEIEKRQKKQFAARRTFNTSATMKTTLYGLFEPNIGSLKFIRHKIDPSISYTYTPDFSSSFYGYFTEIDTGGTISKIDKFEENPFGRTGTRESQFLRISLANLFQAKLIDGDEEKKIDLFTLNFSTGYDFKRDSLRWNDLTTSFRSTPVNGVNLNISATHSFYERKPGTSGAMNKFLLSDGSLPRLLTLNASTSFSLDNKTFLEWGEEEEKKDEEQDTGDLSGGYARANDRSDEFAAKDLDIPWRMSVNLNYSLNRRSLQPVERLDAGLNASVTLTKNWRISWNARVDVVEKDIVYQNFSIYRDLHCWEMSFNWQPTYNYYSFQINVKASELKDIKLTKKPSGRAFN